MKPVRWGVSLLETLVVISLIGILTALILPAVQQSRGICLRSGCQNHLRQIALAVHNFESIHMCLPVPARIREAGRPESVFGDGLIWFAFVLPQLEQDALWRKSVVAYHTNPEPQSNPPHIGLATILDTFVCPADGRLRVPLVDSFGRTAAFTSYLGVRGNLPLANGKIVPNGVLIDGYATVRLSDVIDGTSNTLMVGERPPDEGLRAGWWYTFRPLNEAGPDGTQFIESAHFVQEPFCYGLPGNGGVLFRFGPGRLENPCDRFHFWSLHLGGANFAMADASVRFFSYSAMPLMHALASRNGGEPVELPD